MAEARQLIAQGVREITLIGQDTTCYGEDLAPIPENGGQPGKRPELADLLDALAPVPGLKWLRFLYAYPNKVTTRLLDSIARHDNIAKYFEQLSAFVQPAKYDWLGVFSYSDEEGAKAFDLGDKVPKRTIEARRRKLMRIQNRISRKAKAAWVGREIEVLVEGPSEETELLWQGRTLDHAPEIDGVVLINDFGPHEALVPGTFYRAEITESHDYDVVATILE